MKYRPIKPELTHYSNGAIIVGLIQDKHMSRELLDIIVEHADTGAGLLRILNSFWLDIANVGWNKFPSNKAYGSVYLFTHLTPMNSRNTGASYDKGYSAWRSKYQVYKDRYGWPENRNITEYNLWKGAYTHPDPAYANTPYIANGIWQAPLVLQYKNGDELRYYDRPKEAQDYLIHLAQYNAYKKRMTQNKSLFDIVAKLKEQRDSLKLKLQGESLLGEVPQGELELPLISKEPFYHSPKFTYANRQGHMTQIINAFYKDHINSSDMEKVVEYYKNGGGTNYAGVFLNQVWTNELVFGTGFTNQDMVNELQAKFKGVSQLWFSGWNRPWVREQLVPFFKKVEAYRKQELAKLENYPKAQDIARLREEIIDLHRQIAEKNNKIYLDDKRSSLMKELGL
jgi:hypothetical protein